MRISDWSSDVCSSDLRIDRGRTARFLAHFHETRPAADGDYAWIVWEEAVALLGLRDLAPLVERAIGDGRMPERFVEYADFEAMLADSERSPDDIQRFEIAGLGYIEDVLEALEGTATIGRAKRRKRV